MDKKLCWLGWQLLLPGSGKRVWQIIDHFGGVEMAWRADDKDLRAVPGLKPATVDNIIMRRKQINLSKELDRLQKQRVNVITFDDRAYPPMLKEIFDPPPVLFVRGKLKPYQYGVAVVGSRQATAYGRTAAERLSAELAQCGVAVISGLARGIDTAAHRGALNVQGYTVAVLGCGVDVVYPRENKKIMDEIMEDGVVVSEFPLGTSPEPWHFPSRNRIISGLAHVIVVVEAAEKSGSLITVDLALDLGKEVMAVPGSIYSKTSRGTLKLLKQGAKMVTEVEDILEEIGAESLFTLNKTSSLGKIKLDEIEQRPDRKSVV